MEALWKILKGKNIPYKGYCRLFNRFIFLHSVKRKECFMSRLKFLFILGLLFSSTLIVAQKDPGDVIYIKAPKFTSPLVEKWINEYNKKNNQVKFKFAEMQSIKENVDIQLVISEPSEPVLQTGDFISIVGRYALLPVSSINNPVLVELNKKRLNSKRLKELFFEEDILDEDLSNKSKKKINATIYSGNNNESGAIAFASHFGYSPTNLKGKKISGDDIYLLHAIQKDNSGITFNNLSYLYDMNTRRLKNNVAIIPLDLNKGQQEMLAQSNIDKTIELLENESIDLIPVESFGFVYQNNLPAIKDFLKWILTEGQNYNHQYGFLRLDPKTLITQQKQIDSPYNNNYMSVQTK